MKTAISVVIVAFNESENIEACILSVKPFADEILIIDSYSEDDTVKKAMALGAKIIQQKWLGYAEQKNFGNKLAENDWIFSIDADERVSSELLDSILKWKTGSICKTAYCNRLSSYCGYFLRYGGWYPDCKTRLFNKNVATWEGTIHESLNIDKKERLFFLKGDLLHYPINSIAEHDEQIEKYTDAAASELFFQGKKYPFYKARFNGIFKFIKDYFFKMGFLDGKTGFIVAYKSAYSTYKKYKKLATLHKNKAL